MEWEVNVTRNQLKTAVQTFFASLSSLIARALKTAREKVNNKNFNIKAIVKAGACSRIWNFDKAIKLHMQQTYKVKSNYCFKN